MPDPDPPNHSYWPFVLLKEEQRAFLVLASLFVILSCMGILYRSWTRNQQLSLATISEPPPPVLNRASRTRLQDLPGIGPAKAKAIVRYRRKHGPFQTFDGLKNVKGIGPVLTSRIRKNARLNPDTPEDPEEE